MSYKICRFIEVRNEFAPSRSMAVSAGVSGLSAPGLAQAVIREGEL